MKQRFAACAGLMALALIGTSLVGASDANAQVTFYGLYGSRYYAPGVPPWRVMRIVRSAGFQPVSAVVRRGPNYVVTALDRDGGPVRVVISAYDGDIVGVRPVAALQPYGGGAPYDPRAGAVASAPSAGAAPPDDEPSPSYAPPPGRGGYGPGPGPGPGGAGGYSGPSAGLDRGPQPMPPRAIPNQQQRLATAPPTTGAVTTAPAQPARTPLPRPRPKVASTDTPAATTAPASPSAAARSPAASTTDVPEAPPAPTRARPATPLVPVAPLD